MMKSTAITIMFVVFISLIACSNQQETSYLPLSKGLLWEYQVSSSRGEKHKEIIRVIGEETINGKNYFKVVIVTDKSKGGEPQTRYERKDKNGYYLLFAKDAPEQLIAKLPLKVGNEWIRDRAKCRVESKEVAVLYDKIYNDCFKVAYKDTLLSEIEGYSYFALGVGVVKTVHKSGSVEYTLLRYSKE